MFHILITSIISFVPSLQDFRLHVPRQTVDDLIGARRVVGVARLGNDGTNDALYAGCNKTITENDLVYRVTHSGPLRVGTCEQAPSVSRPELTYRECYTAYTILSLIYLELFLYYQNRCIRLNSKLRTSVMHPRARPLGEERHRQRKDGRQYPSD